MNDSESDTVCDSSPSESPVNSSVRKSKRVRSNVAFVTPDNEPEKDVSLRKMRKFGHPLRFPLAELMAVPAKFIELLSWKNFTTESLKSTQSTGFWKLLTNRLERLTSTGNPKQEYLEVLRSGSWPLSKSSEIDAHFRLMEMR